MSRLQPSHRNLIEATRRRDLARRRYNEAIYNGENKETILKLQRDVAYWQGKVERVSDALAANERDDNPIHTVGADEVGKPRQRVYQWAKNPDDDIWAGILG